MFWYKFWVRFRAVGVAGTVGGSLTALVNLYLQTFSLLDAGLHSLIGLLSLLLLMLSLVTYFAAESRLAQGRPAIGLPQGSWTVLTGNSDVGFHHIIVQVKETEGRYFRIPVSQLPLEEVDEVGGFGGYPREKKTLKVTREGDLARVDIFKETSLSPGSLIPE